jgi:hypothetical protein
MNMANQRQANPYGNQRQVYPGQQQQTQAAFQQGLAAISPQNPGFQAPSGQLPQQAQPQSMMPNMFQGQMPQQPMQQPQPQQRQMPYNQALQQRMMGRGMPPVFGGGGI